MNPTCTWWIILFPIPSPCHALDYITFCIANHCNMINVSLNKTTTTTTPKYMSWHLSHLFLIVYPLLQLHLQIISLHCSISLSHWLFHGGGSSAHGSRPNLCTPVPPPSSSSQFQESRGEGKAASLPCMGECTYDVWDSVTPPPWLHCLLTEAASLPIQIRHLM